MYITVVMQPIEILEDGSLRLTTLAQPAQESTKALANMGYRMTGERRQGGWHMVVNFG